MFLIGLDGGALMKQPLDFSFMRLIQNTSIIKIFRCLIHLGIILLVVFLLGMLFLCQNLPLFRVVFPNLKYIQGVELMEAIEWMQFG